MDRVGLLAKQEKKGTYRLDVLQISHIYHLALNKLKDDSKRESKSAVNDIDIRSPYACRCFSSVVNSLRS